MSLKFFSDVIPVIATRAFANRGVAILLASTGTCLMNAAPACADDTVTLQRLEAHIQQLEERHQSEIKALQAEIRQLRRQKPAAVAATQTPPTDPQRSTAPSGVLSPALPAKVLMTYDRGYHFGFSDATGDNTVELFGRLQVDAGGYPGYSPAPMT